MDDKKESRIDLGVKALFIVWGFPRGTHRSQFMAAEMGMDIVYVPVATKQGKLSILFKYAAQAIKTLLILARQRPRVVFVQDPPIFTALVVYLWGLIGRTRLVIDAHTDALQASFWAWSLPLHRFLSRRAITTIVTNDHLQQIVAAWKAHGFVLTDVPVTFSRWTEVSLSETSFNIVVISTASYDEPIDQVLEAARRLAHVRFYVTGNYANRQDIVASAPDNIRFTGYVPDDEFYGLLDAAQAVMCLTTEDHTIQSGAGEALWLGKPIITSNWPLLQQYFSKGTIHVDNTADSIYQAIITMSDDLSSFQTGICDLREERRSDWQRKLNALAQLIQASL